MTSLSSNEYDKLDGLAMAAMIADGKVSPEALMRCAIDAAKRRTDLNALVYERFEESLELAPMEAPRRVRRHTVPA